MSHPATIWIVDDHDSVRDSLAVLIETMGHRPVSCADGSTFLRTIDPAVHGCVLLDLRLPDLDGLAVFEKMLSDSIDTPVIFITAYPSIATAVRATQLGAVNYLEKPIGQDLLTQHLDQALQLDLTRREMSHRREVIDSRMKRLTPREREVMQLVVDGLASKDIARKLHLSIKTVALHRAHIMKKLQAGSVVHLVRMVTMPEIADLTKPEAHHLN